MTLQPTQLKILDEGSLQIKWSDGQLRRYPVAELREGCPCATCNEKRKAPPPPATSLPVISQAETQPLRITHMEPMGRYAYGIHFSDGHDTGLFTLESLRELGTEFER
jgi:DUF971 family protein